MMIRTTLEKIEKPVAVAVEGLDYWYTLLGQINDDPDFQEIQLLDFKRAPYGNFRRWLELFRTLDGYEDRIRAIGVIQDAEEDAQSAFQSISQTLRNAGITPPGRPMEVTGGKPAVGILIMPHDRPSGCLEHSVLEARASGISLHCAEQYLQCVGTGDRNENWQAKVKVHASIAASRNPASTLSESVAAGLWDFTHPALKIMKDFMRLLCGC